MPKKWLLVGLALVLLVSLGGMISCGGGSRISEPSIVGLYVNPDDPEVYLELKGDGTFYNQERGLTGQILASTGTWEVHGDQLRLTLPIGIGIVAWIEGDKIIGPQGDVLIKNHSAPRMPELSIVGVYVNPDDPELYLELKEDGTFYNQERGLTGQILASTGTWEVQGDQLRLTLPIGIGIVAWIEGNKLIGPQGEVLIKNHSAARTPEPSIPTTLTEGSPGWVISAFYEALREGRYSDAAKHFSSSYIERYPELRGLSPEKAAEKIAKELENINKLPDRIEVLFEDIEGETAYPRCILYYPNGEEEEVSYVMVKENSLWKIDM